MSYRVSRLLRDVKAKRKAKGRPVKFSITAGTTTLEYRRCGLPENHDPNCGWPHSYTIN